jgi:hypothetical protein
MKTFTRVCVEDTKIVDPTGRELVLKKGQQYLTSGEHNGMVTVFTAFWATVPAALFAYEQIHTGG